MKQFWLQVIALMIVAFSAIWVTFHPTVLDGFLSPSTAQINQTTTSSTNTTQMVNIVSASGQTKASLKIEVANTAASRALGLGQRASLDPNSGMLFLFDSPTVPQFWMKDMHFPLDMIWINGDTIVGAQENVPPPAGTPGEVLPIYSPTTSVDKVLEVNAGYVSAHSIINGDKLQEAQ